MGQADASLEAIVFGEYGYGWGSYCKEKSVIPDDKQGKIMTLEQAEPWMQTWKFSGYFDSPECHATYVWTNKRVIWVTHYDGATCLDSAPRNPTDIMPEIPGG